MEKVTLGADLVAKLNRPAHQAVLADASGRMIGYFMTPDLLYELTRGRFEDEPTPAELQAARDEYKTHGGYTTAQVLAHLADLEAWYKEHRG